MHPQVQAFFDPQTSTVSYVLFEAAGGACAIIDPVLDFDPKAGRTNTVQADRIVDFVRENGLSVEWILETHVHADHLSAAPFLKSRLGGASALAPGSRTCSAISSAYSTPKRGSPRTAASLTICLPMTRSLPWADSRRRAIHTPGHTPACMSYLIEDALFVGDTLFMPDGGTARADFPGGDARQLYRSIRRLLELPGNTRMFICHDYQPGNRQPAWETTVAEQRRANIHVRDGISEDEFVRMRTQRDATLAMPLLIIPAVQVNMRAGELPPAEDNGVHYLKVPVDLL